ncbi:MAG: C10 family peptidase [Paludibacteraceae bacterium]|nr:C10 family peptidase [Paludibacteraceae bacterium]
MNRILAIFFSLSMALPLFSGERTVEQAAGLAANFVKKQSGFRMRHQAPAEASDMQLAYTGMVKDQPVPAYYVFNSPDNEEAVFISADDRTQPVLGYIEAGGFDYNTANPSLRWWLNRYSRQLAAISEIEDIQASSPAETYTSVAPLLGKIEYDQEKPYSNLCPLDGTHRSLTGCVATAAAQVMRFWKYPAQGTGSHSYTSSGLRKQVSADFNVPYDWDNMLESYSGSYNATQASAIATLMFHCGVACDMDYSYNDGSAAYTDDMAAGLTKYFGYRVSKFVTQISARDYGGAANFTPAEYSVKTTQIRDYIYADLEQGRPVILGGNDTYGEGGHEFVCDGRDANGRLHINWGWSGDGNGYFAITALDYDGYEFSSDLDAILGVEPAQTEYVPVESISLNPSSLTLKINEKQTVVVNILPANSSVRIASWTSSDPAVASVSNGTVKGVSQGTAVITATAEGRQATATVTVTSEVVASQDFILVTDDANLQVGDQILIVNEDNQVALGATQNKNNRSEASVFINGNAIQIDENNTDAQIITLTQGLSQGTFGLLTPDGYLYAASSSKNYLRSQAQLTDDASWTISITDGEALITAQGNNTRNTISYNSHNQIFSTYKLLQAPVAVYARMNHTGLPVLQADQPAASKLFRNGRLVIVIDDKEYNAQGIQTR